LTPKEGAQTIIYLATSPEVTGVTGRYFVKRDPVRSSQISYDENIAQKLRVISEKLTSKI
jgi:hypothetical protein